MKKMLAASLVLMLCAVAAQATVIKQTDLWTEITKVGTINVVYDTLDVDVDVYDLTMYMSDKLPNGFQTTINITVGSDANSNSDDPLQSQWIDRVKVGGKWTLVPHPCPTELEILYFNDPAYGDEPDYAIYDTDTRFLPYVDPGDDWQTIDNWGSITPPSEDIDTLEYDGGAQYEPYVGTGDLWAICALPTEMQDPNLELVIARVGVVQGDKVWVKSTSGYYDGEYDRADNTVFEIPEPATLTLLGLGALALIRRRRT